MLRAGIASTIALGFALGLAPTLARAQTAAGDDNYRALVNSGLQEFATGSYQEALVHLEQAFRIRPGGRVQGAIAKTRFELRQYALTVQLCDAALANGLDPLNPSQRAEIESLRGRALAYTGTLTLRVTPDSADVLLDGRPYTAEQRAQQTRVDIGAHNIEISARGFATQHRTVDIAGNGNTQVVVVALVPSGATGNPLFYVSAGVGVLSAGGIVASTIWLINRSDALGTCQAALNRGGHCVNGATLASENDVALWSLIGSSGLFVASAVVFGVVLGSSSRQDRAPGPSVACMPLQGGGLCTAGVRW